MNPFRGILLFSAVETLAVVVWAALAGIESTAGVGNQLLAAVLFFAFFVVEHVMAFNVSKGRPLFDRVRP